MPFCVQCVTDPAQEGDECERETTSVTNARFVGFSVRKSVLRSGNNRDLTAPSHRVCSVSELHSNNSFADLSLYQCRHDTVGVLHPSTPPVKAVRVLRDLSRNLETALALPLSTVTDGCSTCTEVRAKFTFCHSFQAKPERRTKLEQPLLQQGTLTTLPSHARRASSSGTTNEKGKHKLLVVCSLYQFEQLDQTAKVVFAFGTFTVL